MLYYDTIDVSERIDVNKTVPPKECNICHYWYFLNYSFKFQTNTAQKMKFSIKDSCGFGHIY